ncbi:hypothetical protein O0L34_g1776 [Tuta absoluta]|nr:hypothetical protein O0L34_g1776 [Tuta absoluta]
MLVLMKYLITLSASPSMGLGSGSGHGVVPAAAGVILAAELFAPLLLLCGLCCWPDDQSDTSSTGKHPQTPVVTRTSTKRDSSHRRLSNVFSRHAASSTTSLHLPSTSGNSKKSLSAHRSHEEIPARRRSHSHLEPSEEDERYHSAPSVIDEVIHRRDWEHSTKELYIPLRPDVSQLFDVDLDSDISSPAAPRAEAESSSVECLRSEPTITCKKHHTNIKSSRNRTKKESIHNDVKDTDATENQFLTPTSDFYIGETLDTSSILRESQSINNNIEVLDGKIKSVYKAKDDKQSINESIKTKDRPHIKCIDDEGIDLPLWEGFKVKMVDMDMDFFVDELDRSGAIHRDTSRGSLVTCVSRMGQFPPPSVEAVGWEGGACYLAEAGCLRSRAKLLAAERSEACGVRARHASDGDILAPTLRPESGAFSESDLELDLEAGNERPPPYEEVHRTPHKETAI